MIAGKSSLLDSEFYGNLDAFFKRKHFFRYNNNISLFENIKKSLTAHKHFKRQHICCMYTTI